MVQLVGILNITPDSFSDGGQFISPEAALAQADRLFADGAALIDVGAESTRPGATPLTPEAEWQRLEPVLPELLKRYPGKISLDTFHPETARRALEKGTIILNDVTGMTNPAMIATVLENKLDCIISYLPGPNIQAVHQGNLVSDVEVVIDGLLAKAQLLQDGGLAADKIILDPGIGFGKTPELNEELLKIAKYLPDYRVMIGYSRKRFLGEHRMDLDVNLAAGKIARDAGAAYLRVHDVAGHRELVY